MNMIKGQILEIWSEISTQTQDANDHLWVVRIALIKIPPPPYTNPNPNPIHQHMGTRGHAINEDSVLRLTGHPTEFTVVVSSCDLPVFDIRKYTSACFLLLRKIIRWFMVFR
ncbi:hypothetical protein KQX54_004443 [Cotesia glomerata]|uniref:Uncharacterized protein n=1 Tax=Cotesia glomerata TaxID=32391 RepID=A0AAV7HWZ3_COTGL|nr:hypothetical protein KQX54_004443 [Cotesia glomerata]